MQKQMYKKHKRSYNLLMCALYHCMGTTADNMIFQIKKTIYNSI